MRTSDYARVTWALLAALAAAEVAAQPVLTQEDFLSIGDRARGNYYLNIDATGLTAPGPTGDWDFTGSSGETVEIHSVECR